MSLSFLLLVIRHSHFPFQVRFYMHFLIFTLNRTIFVQIFHYPGIIAHPRTIIVQDLCYYISLIIKAIVQYKDMTIFPKPLTHNHIDFSDSVSLIFGRYALRIQPYKPFVDSNLSFSIYYHKHCYSIPLPLDCSNGRSPKYIRFLRKLYFAIVTPILSDITGVLYRFVVTFFAR